MARVLKSTKGDIAFQAEFAEPAFDLFRDSWGFYRRLYSALSVFGLRLNEIRPERGAGSLGDIHVALTLFDFITSVRIRTDRLEINCVDMSRVDGKALENATVQILETIKNHATGLQYKSYSLAIGVHGTVEGIEAKSFLAQFVRASSLDLGPQLAAGGVFYNGPQGDRLLSAVTLDLSALMSGGLFIRAYAAWDGRRVDSSSLPSIANKYWSDVLAALDLSLE